MFVLFILLYPPGPADNSMRSCPDIISCVNRLFQQCQSGGVTELAVEQPGLFFFTPTVLHQSAEKGRLHDQVLHTYRLA